MTNLIEESGRVVMQIANLMCGYDTTVVTWPDEQRGRLRRVPAQANVAEWEKGFRKRQSDSSIS